MQRAGRALREYLQTPPDAQDDALAERVFEALEIADWWRAQHAGALGKATMGLRSRYQTVLGPPPRVTQRHKRMATIADKLRREPGMRLDRMHDIAGCRAVVNTVDDLRRLWERYHERPPRDGILREYDYVSQPKESGYRAIHLIVLYDGMRVEIQLRTRIQHEWAEAIEQFGGVLRHDLKSGYGPEPVLQFMEAVAEAMAYEDVGEPVPRVLSNRIKQLRVEAAAFFGGRR